ncbi:hypothetical protein DEA98_28590 (plasmid) [Brucella pseudogrignonensis]|nr:hypothetical protein [Brucella pseudogrignonensis]
MECQSISLIRPAIERRSVKGQARRAACQRQNGFQALRPNLPFCFAPTPLQTAFAGIGLVPSLTGKSCCFPDQREEVSPNGAINGAQKMEDAEKANYATVLSKVGT